MDTALIISPAAAIIGTIVGSSVQFWFSRKSEGRRRIEEQRMRAYVDFVSAVSRLAIAQKNGNERQEIEANILLSDAKIRIGLYGRREVIQSLARISQTFKVHRGAES
ncbi:MAG: hypothetical protein ACLPTZ_19180 [Beijerinckiaceae bacterium]